MSKIEVGKQQQERMFAFLATFVVVMMVNNWAFAAGGGALDLTFMDVIANSAESVADHKLWAVSMVLLAFGCLAAFGFTGRKEALFGLLVPLLMAGALINWRSLFSAVIAGLTL
jgi:hypothetical protein